MEYRQEIASYITTSHHTEAISMNDAFLKFLFDQISGKMSIIEGYVEDDNILIHVEEMKKAIQQVETLTIQKSPFAGH